MDSMQIEDRQVVTLLAFDAQEAGGRTLATAISSTFMDRYIEQDCTSTHMKDAAQALADEQMSKVARGFSPACATVCLSGPGW